ncbi:MAG TPA: amino acid permease [Steroidobacteraceae bacterium]|nr:amino acid permease [Steroidobacteraceae bacterium]
MQQTTAQASGAHQSDDSRLESLGYKPQLNRVLSYFGNFAVAFTYLSPMVGIYSLFVLGVGSGGPAYVWLTWIPVVGMLFVALVFGELASHYPVAGALYQYSKFSAGPKYGWFVGWVYGLALLITVAAVDTGVVSYVAALTHNGFGWNLDPANNQTILAVTVVLLAVQTALNITGAQVMGRVAKFGVYVEIIGTLGIAIILAVHGFNHGFDFLFTTQGVENAATNPTGLDFGGHWLTGAALISVLAPVYIFYGFEAAGDISEETKDAGVQVPRAMRWALIWGGVSSFILIAALLLAMPAVDPVKATVAGGGVPFILSSLPGWLQDFLLLMIVFAFFSCGTSIQGAGSRLMFSYARDGALPASPWVAKVSDHFKTPVNALLAGSVVTVLFVLLVYATPENDIHIGFITYPAHINALVSLVSFGVSGIYFAFLLTVIAAIIAKGRGWKPEGRFQLGKWRGPVYFLAATYLGLMLLNVVAPTGLTSPRGSFNLDWITLLVMAIISIAGALYLFIARPDKRVQERSRR